MSAIKLSDRLILKKKYRNNYGRVLSGLKRRSPLKQPFMVFWSIPSYVISPETSVKVSTSPANTRRKVEHPAPGRPRT